MRITVTSPLSVLEIKPNGQIGDVVIPVGTYELVAIQNPFSGKAKADEWLIISGTQKGMGINAWKLSDRVKFEENQ